MPSIPYAQSQAESTAGPAWRRFLQRLGPYQSLLLLSVPVSLVEPLKIIAVAVAGEGHWITGTAMMLGAYAASLLLVERLFKVLKPKLLTLNWFARLWTGFVALRDRIARSVGASPAGSRNEP